MKKLESISPKHLLAGTVAVSAIPFLAVELFKPQLYRIFDISHYLIFHNLSEFFSVMVSLSIFGLGWYAFDQNKDRHALFLSVSFLAIGLMDFMHTLAYAGMPPLITPNSPNKSTQFWIAVQLFSASAFLSSAFVYADRTSRWLTKPSLMAAALAVSSTVFVSVTFFPEYVPTTFIQGVGLTPFKTVSEYVIICLLVLACIMYWRRLSRTGERQCNYYLAAFVLCIFSELVFAGYKSAFDTYNVLGHIYRIIAFGFIYKGVFVASVRKPYEKLLVSNEELRLNRNMLYHIMNSIPQSIFWKDRESVYLGCNQVFARQAGIDSPEDIVGRSDFDLPWGKEASEGYRADDREVMESAQAKFHIIETLRKSDGADIWIDTSKVPLTDSSGSINGVLGVYEDITERKQAEEELQRKNAEIEQFIYTTSHDLRTPVVTVKTFLGYLESDMAVNDRERIAQDLQFIHSAADKMKMLLDELLEMSRIDRVETPPVLVSLREVLAEALDALAGIINERKVDIRLPDTDLMLLGDRPRLCQIWQNLIENAIKYSSDDSPPRIELGVQEMGGETVFFVKDNGIGIDPQYHAKIFGIFEKLDPRSSGVGLGLSMIQRIVEKCGGRVWVESDGSGKGACFFFTLPSALVQG